MNSIITREFLTGLKNQNIKKSDFKSIIKGSEIVCNDVTIRGKYTIIELKFNEKYFHGLAICNHSDRNSTRTGMAIAYRRAFVDIEGHILEKLMLRRIMIQDFHIFNVNPCRVIGFI